MSFAIFIVLVLGLFIGLLNMLPTAAALGLSFTPAISTIILYMRAWDFMFPIHELLLMLSVYVGLEITLWLWHVGMRTVRFIRGHSDGA